LHGVYLIWFPITALRPQPLEKIISESKIQKYLQVELTILDVKKENKGLLGCQLLIINPTWRLTESLNKILPYLWDIFRIKGQGKWSIFQSE
jgi:23S rRNA (adenine2030-N6)-methyltransferase